jgi:protease I
MVRHFSQANKPIASVCHGAQVLAAAGVIEGKTCSAYPAVAPEVTHAGGKYVDIPGERPTWTANWSPRPIGLLMLIGSPNS